MEEGRHYGYHLHDGEALIGGFQVGPFQLDYQQAAAAKPSGGHGRDYRFEEQMKNEEKLILNYLDEFVSGDIWRR